jgi:hypothetical protein
MLPQKKLSRSNKLAATVALALLLHPPVVPHARHQLKLLYQPLFRGMCL